MTNNGDGTFTNSGTLNSMACGSSIKLGDIDNDGDLDIVATTENDFSGTPQILVYRNDGIGNFNLYTSYSNNNNNGIADLVDLNNDNKLDYLNFGDWSNNSTSKLYYCTWQWRFDI